MPNAFSCIFDQSDNQNVEMNVNNYGYEGNMWKEMSYTSCNPSFKGEVLVIVKVLLCLIVVRSNTKI